jgi:multidrug transporter EmrE-like cation transporter
MSPAGWIFVIVSAVCAVAANLLLRSGIENQHGFSGSMRDYLALFRQGAFLLGMLCYVFATLSWIKVLSSEPLNVAYPILASITFAMVVAMASFLFGEPVTVMRIIGLVFLIVGITLMAQS